MDTVTAERIALKNAGYIPTPCDGKKPILPGWQDRLQINVADIELWREERPAVQNTGALTRNNPTFDIDVMDANVADRIEAIIRQHATDGEILVRYGREPKRAIPFRLIGEPFKKIRTPIFIDTNGVENKVEVLSDGQQFVVAGIHPDTSRPYTWQPRPLHAVASDQLPSINECEASILIEQFTAILRQTGWKEKAFSKSKTISQRAAATITPPIGKREEAYGAKALENAADEVAGAAHGERNEVLNAKAYTLGRQVAAGRINQTSVENELLNAAEKSGLIKDNGLAAAQATIASGMKAGLKSPAPPLEDRTNGSQGSQHKEGESEQQDAGGMDTERLILSSAEFVESFETPDPLIESILMRKFIYALTGHVAKGKTSVALLWAAHVALGRMLGNLEVEQGRVLYLAGENYVDVQMRWIAMAQQMDFDPKTIPVHFRPGRFKLSGKMERLRHEVDALSGVDFIIIDSSAAFFEGDDENSNAQAGVHACRLRELTKFKGEPCVLVLCHPPKNAGDDNLQPRGAGAMIAEWDGNLTATKDGSVTTIHYQIKIRGPDFSPISFLLRNVTHERLVSKRGN